MKFLKIGGITAIVVLVLSVLGVTLAFAQQPSTQPSPQTSPQTNPSGSNNMMQGSGMMGNGSGMMGGNSQSMNQMHSQMSQNGGMQAMQEWMHQSGGVHDFVWQALADQLGLKPEELTSQMQSGKTLAQIALEKGISTKDLAATMETSMKAGLAKAVKDGQLTQVQADVMIQQMAGQYEWMLDNMGTGMMGIGSGGCHNTNQPTNNGSSS